MWRFLIDSNIHEHNCLRKLRKILRICNHLIKVTRKAEVLPSTPDQEVQFTVLIQVNGWHFPLQTYFLGLTLYYLLFRCFRQQVYCRQCAASLLMNFRSLVTVSSVIRLSDDQTGVILSAPRLMLRQESHFAVVACTFESRGYSREACIVHSLVQSSIQYHNSDLRYIIQLRYRLIVLLYLYQGDH